MPSMRYKGYEISASAAEAKDQDLWRAVVEIRDAEQGEGGRPVEELEPEDTFRSEDEAEAFGMKYGKEWADHQRPDGE